MVYDWLSIVKYNSYVYRSSVMQNLTDKVLHESIVLKIAERINVSRENYLDAIVSSIRSSNLHRQNGFTTMVELKAAIHQIQHKIIHLRSIGENSSGRKCAQRHWKTLEMQSKGMHIEESTMVTFRRYRSRLLDLPQLSVLLKKINTSILPEDVIKSDVCINTASSIKPEDVIK